jgi:RHS repeat-associated protein
MSFALENDAETGLYHTGPRTYNPWSGGFGQPDPLDFLSMGVSPYAYSFDNPVTYSDPFGLDTMWTYMPNNNGGYDLKPQWIPDNIATPQNQGSIMDYYESMDATLEAWANAAQEQADYVQRQASAQAKAETKAFYNGIFQSTANLSDNLSESANYALLGEIALSPESGGGSDLAIPMTEALGDIADLTSFGAKALDAPVTGSLTPALSQLLKTFTNTLTLRIPAVERAGANLANPQTMKQFEALVRATTAFVTNKILP